MAILIVCVQTFNHDSERSDFNLTKCIVLVETASQSPTFWHKEALLLILADRRVVYYLAS